MSYATELMSQLIKHAEETGEKRETQLLAPDLYQELEREMNGLYRPGENPRPVAGPMMLVIMTPWGRCEIRRREPEGPTQ